MKRFCAFNQNFAAATACSRGARRALNRDMAELMKERRLSEYSVEDYTRVTYIKDNIPLLIIEFA